MTRVENEQQRIVWHAQGEVRQNSGVARIWCEGGTELTRAQQLLTWATVPEQSGPKSGGGTAVPLYVGELIPI